MLSDFLGRFHGNIRYQPIGDRSLRLFVNSIDFYRFKAVAQELGCAAPDKATKALINEIVSAIDSIGSYGVKAGKRLYAGYQEERKVKDRKGKTAQRKGANRAGKSEKTNPFPAKYANRIICEDSLKALRRLPDNCVDLVFTSPPRTISDWTTANRRIRMTGPPTSTNCSGYLKRQSGC